MENFVTQFANEAAAEKTGLAVLGVDPKALLLQLITFVVFFLILKKFAFTKIVAMLDEREKTINKGVKLGVEMEAEKAKLDDQVQAALSVARKDADKIIGEAHTDAGEIIRAAEESATRKTDALLAEARGKIESDTNAARVALRKEMLQYVAEATEAIIAEKLDDKKDASLIERVLKGAKA